MTDERTERERILSYHVAQGAKYSFAELWPRVVSARLDLLETLGDVSEDASGWAPAASAWTVADVAEHLLAGSRSVRELVQALAAGESGEAPNFEPERAAPQTPLAELAAELRDDALAWAVMTASLPSRPPLEPVATHFMFGDMHARAWYLFQRTHDLDHIGQLRAIQAAPGYPGRAR